MTDCSLILNLCLKKQNKKKQRRNFAPPAAVSPLLPLASTRRRLLLPRLLREVEVHFVVDVFALRIEALQDLRQHIDSLLAAQPRALGLELLQQVFGGHRFTDQVAPHRLLR